MSLGSWVRYGWKGPAIVTIGSIPCILLAAYLKMSGK
jgi:hypothetical protein